jgi:hypothetical protein
MSGMTQKLGDRSRAEERETAIGCQRLSCLSPRSRWLILAPGIIALALCLSGCDKCGDYFWQNGSKSCHDESQLK